MCSLTLLAAMILAATPASALEYTESDAAAGSFGKPTSVEPVTVIGGSNTYETDVSKNAAYIPPAFGSPMSDLPGSGELLTPNLTGSTTGTVTGGGTVTIIPPSASGTTGSTVSTGYTAVTSDLYYSGGYLGTLSAPAIGLSVKVYQGTDSAALKNGAGHFESTSIWDGNVAFAGHNRGVNNNFGKIHTLENGDTIKLTTKLGTRSYTVYSVRKVSVNDVSVLDSTGENIVTLVTCVMNQPDYRWCVQARQK
ncbi:MAG: class D sortase [Oscillibacter sp.]|nr:class D sortase [Oscillibacter sp.]MEA4994749.1 class D sortase [Oscillibacter sp.]